MNKTTIIVWCIAIIISAVAVFVAIDSARLRSNEAGDIYSDVSERLENSAEPEIGEVEPQISDGDPTPEWEILPDESAEEQFITYENVGGNSGISAFQYGADYIRVKFSSGAIYRYTYRSAGASNIEQMKVLADSGAGLNSFINREVRQLYEAREQ
jgi:hypothetical protein